MLPAVTELLSFAVTGHGVGVFGPVALPVIWMACPPLLLAIAADVAVFGIGGDLLPMVVGAALTAANRPSVAVKFGKSKTLLTVAAAPFPHNRRCPTEPRLTRRSQAQTKKKG
jgi:hypothetical protein